MIVRRGGNERKVRRRIGRPVGAVGALAGVLASVVVITAAPIAAPVARAATLTVDSRLLGPDVSVGDGICLTAAGTCTFQAAIQQANALLPGEDVLIDFAPSTWGVTFETPLTTGGTVFTANVPDGRTLTIAGPPPPNRRPNLSGGAAGSGNRILDQTGPGRLVVRDIGFFDGTAIGSGGAVRALGQVELLRVEMSSNTADGSGGALAVIAGQLTVRDSAFVNNIAGNGNAISAGGNSVLIEDTEFSFGGGAGATVAITDAAATATLRRVAIRNVGATGVVCTCASLLVEDSSFTGIAGDDGGAIRTTAPTVVRRSTFENNSSLGPGGGISATAIVPVTVEDSFFRANVALSGGAIACAECTVDLTRTSFLDNDASTSGAAVAMAGQLTIRNSYFSNNDADLGSGSGGAIFVRAPGAGVTIDDSHFRLNDASRGGAIHQTSGAGLVVNRTTFENNRANTVGGQGGAIYSADPNGVSLRNVTFISNGAPGGGSALRLDAGSASLWNVTAALNTGPAALSVSTGLVPEIVNSVFDNTTDCNAFSYATQDTPSIIRSGACTPDVAGTRLTDVPTFQGYSDRGGTVTTPFGTVPVLALTELSPGLDAGTCILPTDARGLSRLAQTTCDLGAVESRMEVDINPVGSVPSPSAAVSLSEVPQTALTDPPVDGVDGSVAITTARLRGIDLESLDLAAIPLRSIALDALELTPDLLDAVTIAEVPLRWTDPATGVEGGWPEFLAAAGLVELAAQPANTVTLLQVLRDLEGRPGAPQLDVQSLDLSNTVLGDLPIGALVLSDYTLDELALPAGTTWCGIIAEFVPADECGPGRTIDPATATLVSISLEGVPLRSIPLRSIPLRSIDLATVPLRSIPLRSIDLEASPLRSIPLRSILLEASPLRSIPLRSIPLRSIDLEASPLRSIPLRSIDLTASPLRSIPLRSILLEASPLRSIPLRSIPLRSIDLSASPLRSIPLRSILLESAPLRSIPLRSILLEGTPLRSIPLRSIANLTSILDCQVTTPTSPFTCAVNGTLGDVPIEAFRGTLGDLLAALPADTELGFLGDLGFTDDTLTLGDLAAFFDANPQFTYGDLDPVFDLDGSPYVLADIAAVLSATPGVTLDQIVGFLTSLTSPEYTLGDLAAAFASPDLAPGGGGSAAGEMTFELFFELLLQFLPDATVGDLFAGILPPGEVSWQEIDLDAAADALRLGTDTGVLVEAVITSNAPADTSAALQLTLPEGVDFVPGSMSIGGRPLNPFAIGNVVQTSALLGENDNVLEFRVVAPFETGTSGITLQVDTTTWGDAAGTTSLTVTDALEVNDTFGQAVQLTDPNDQLVISHVKDAVDEDWFALDVLQGQELSVNLSNLDADYDVLLYGPAQPALRGEPRASLVPSPDNGLSLLGDDGATPAAISADVDTSSPAPELQFLDGSARRGTDDERIDTGPLPTGRYYLRISGYNGATSARPYVLRARVDGAPIGGTCAALPPVVPTTLTLAPATTTITPDTDTLILVDPARLQRSYPASAALVTSELDEFVTALRTRPGDFAGTDAAVVRLDQVPAVATAMAQWDASPCEPTRANAVVTAIGAHLDSLVAAHPGIRHVVLVGADDQIPMARVRDATPVHNETEYAGEFDENSPLSSALALGYVFSDDPYGAARPLSVGTRELFVPELAVGRLVETPGDIAGALDRFATSNGLLSPQTALTSGYAFLSDGSNAVGDELADVVPPDQLDRLITNTWTRQDLIDRFAQAGPDIASVNAHFDHYRALPADQDAQGRLTDPFTLDDVTAPSGSPLAGSLLFSMGCHGGLSVSDIAVGALDQDWAQTFASEGALFAGNTGYGYGDSVSVLFSERLMTDFADRLDESATVGLAMVDAKQEYVSGLVQVSPFEEKVSSQVVFYGLPMFRIAGATPEPPEPPRPTTVDPVTGLVAASIDVAAPSVEAPPTPRGRFWTVDGDIQATPYQPIQPRVVLDVTQPGSEARGAIVTAATSTDVTDVDPVIVTPVDDVTGADPEAGVDGALFPTTLQSVSRAVTSDGARDRLVLVPGQFRDDPTTSTGEGTQRRFTELDATVLYAPDGSTDLEAPGIDGVDGRVIDGRVQFDVDVRGDDVVRVVVLWAPAGVGDKVWRSLELAPAGQRWTGSSVVPAGVSSVEYFVQVVDSGANVSVSSDKGANFTADVAPPPPPPPPGAPTLTVPPVPASGWFTDSVTVGATVPAGASVEVRVDGVPVPGTSVTLDRTGLFTVSATTDGGVTTSTVVAVDLTAPEVLAAPASGALPAPTTIGITARDSGSGVASFSYRRNGGPEVAVTGSSVRLLVTGTTTIVATAVDAVGRTTTETFSYTVVSADPPTVAASVVPVAGQPAPTGVYTAPPTVRITATAGSAPVASVRYSLNGATPVDTNGSTVDVPITSQGTTVVTYSAIDSDGRRGADATVSVTVDTVAPVVTCPAAPTFRLGQAGATVTATVTGGTAPTASAPAVTTTITAGGTPRTVTISASDANGNVGQAACPYRVEYVRTGFFSPVDMSPIVNVARAGQAIPVSWQLTTATGAPVTSTASFTSITYVFVSCQTNVPVDDVEEYASLTGNSGLQYLGSGRWQVNWKSERSFAGRCAVMTVRLADGSSISANFRFR